MITRDGSPVQLPAHSLDPSETVCPRCRIAHLAALGRCPECEAEHASPR